MFANAPSPICLIPRKCSAPVPSFPPRPRVQRHTVDPPSRAPARPLSTTRFSFRDVSPRDRPQCSSRFCLCLSSAHGRGHDHTRGCIAPDVRPCPCHDPCCPGALSPSRVHHARAPDAPCPPDAIHTPYLVNGDVSMNGHALHRVHVRPPSRDLGPFRGSHDHVRGRGRDP